MGGIERLLCSWTPGVPTDWSDEVSGLALSLALMNIAEPMAIAQIQGVTIDLALHAGKLVLPVPAEFTLRGDSS